MYRVQLPEQIARQGQRSLSFRRIFVPESKFEAVGLDIHSILIDCCCGPFAGTQFTFVSRGVIEIETRRWIVLPEDQGNACERNNVPGIENCLAGALTVYERPAG